MSVRFDRHGRLIVVRARLWGPTGDAVVRMALDTGATSTLVRTSRLIMLGFDPDASAEYSEVATGSSVERVPIVVVDIIRALRQERSGLRILCHTLPPEVGVDGLLGLDFLRDQRLVIDFRQGKITLT